MLIITLSQQHGLGYVCYSGLPLEELTSKKQGLHLFTARVVKTIIIICNCMGIISNQRSCMGDVNL